MRPVADLPLPLQGEMCPYAVVTPDGAWHEHDWRKHSTAEQMTQATSKWTDRVHCLLSQHKDTIVVGLDCHS
jgi:hypothetical protein